MEKNNQERNGWEFIVNTDLLNEFGWDAGQLLCFLLSKRKYFQSQVTLTSNRLFYLLQSTIKREFPGWSGWRIREATKKLEKKGVLKVIRNNGGRSYYQIIKEKLPAKYHHLYDVKQTSKNPYKQRAKHQSSSLSEPVSKTPKISPLQIKGETANQFTGLTGTSSLGEPEVFIKRNKKKEEPSATPPSLGKELVCASLSYQENLPGKNNPDKESYPDRKSPSSSSAPPDAVTVISKILESSDSFGWKNFRAGKSRESAEVIENYRLKNWPEETPESIARLCIETAIKHNEDTPEELQKFPWFVKSGITLKKVEKELEEERGRREAMKDAMYDSILRNKQKEKEEAEKREFYELDAGMND